MSKTKKNNVKVFQLSDSEVSELSFYAMNTRKSEIEMDWWSRATVGMREAIMKRFSIPEGAVINWDIVFSKGEITVTEPKDEPVITAKPE